MRGQWKLSLPLSTPIDIHVLEILVSECVDIHEQLTLLSEAPAAAKLARIIRHAIERANGVYNAGLQDIPPLPPDMSLAFDMATGEIVVTATSDGSDSITVCGKLTPGVLKTSNPKLTTTGEHRFFVDAGKIYFIAAFATGTGGESDLNDEQAIMIPALVAPALAVTRDGEVNTITITPGDEYPATYAVFRGDEPGIDETSTLVYDGADLEITDTVVGSAYYRARATTAVGDGPWSAETAVS